MKKFIIRSLIGIFFGAFLSIVMTYTVIWGGQETLNSAVFLRNSLGTMFCGWFFTVSNLLFENHSWSLLRRTITHFAIVMVLYFVLGFGIGWFPFTLEGFLIVLVIFVVCYFVFWLACYAYFKNQAQKMNKELSNK
ncbi:DUF3021 domain-containing protein [Planococcus donghaensis]|uniref:DUF3021 domain-containing protein n=1 Tax=Planococcus donghaensis TaxID=414778 RepID=A0A1C7EK60_9BACL|nr:DUF3021 domain-containing protein [Planococcus donghaensis]ANU24208.1 hypothetical protein BCM40_12975 [Planococcus donghaensis]